jgi:hypothetical protein
MPHPIKKNVSGNSVVVAVPHQVSCDLAGEAAILHLKTGVYYELNPVGARIWSLLERSRTVNELRDAVLAEYEVEPRRCEDDLHELLGRLAEEGLIEIRDESTG